MLHRLQAWQDLLTGRHHAGTVHNQQMQQWGLVKGRHCCLSTLLLLLLLLLQL
jgi:hypothetical protein